MKHFVDYMRPVQTQKQEIIGAKFPPHAKKTSGTQGRLSVNFLQLRLTKKLKILNFFCFKKLNIN